jgi:hypothetical protein
LRLGIIELFLNDFTNMQTFRKISYLWLILFFALPCVAWSQEGDEDDKPNPAVNALPDTAKKSKIDLDEQMLKLGMSNFKDQVRGRKGIRVAFYNAENLFDTFNDSLTNDEDFLPTGKNAWSYKRYMEKLNNIYRVLTAVGGWEMPEVVGFCEIENRLVLQDLLKKTPFRQHKYDIVHENSPDARGIDVGLIYRKDKFKYISHEAIRVIFTDDPKGKTRDILYTKGLVLGKDTLHVFVNHWPSRRGGQAKSEPRRVDAAKLVRKKVDSIYAASPLAKIVIMGDLNDHVEDKSVAVTLNAKADTAAVGSTDLYDFMAPLSHNWKLGSHKYQGHWGTLDHVIVSAPLLKGGRKGQLKASPAQIFAARFLLEEDKKYLGLQPFRTYVGPRYAGGFSDHLPVYVDLMFE